MASIGHFPGYEIGLELSHVYTFSEPRYNPCFHEGCLFFMYNVAFYVHSAFAYFCLQAYTEVPSTPLHTAAVLREEEENWQDVKVRGSSYIIHTLLRTRSLICIINKL